jgi:nitroreductase
MERLFIVQNTRQRRISQFWVSTSAGWALLQDYAAAVQNMLLAITGLGYASVWLDGVLRSRGIAEKIGALLNVPQGKNMTVTVILPVGVPEEKGRQNDRLPFEQRVWYNRRT